MANTSNDVLSRFIEYRLVKEGFCITSNTRNAAVTPILSESTPSQSQKTESVQESPIESAWKALRECLTSANKETSTYKPLCRFLTLLAERKLLFIPWDCKTTGELYRQHILVVNAKSGETDRFLGGDFALAHPLENGKVRSKVYYSDIQMVGEVFACDAPKESFALFNHAVQVLKYQFTTSRCQPQHAFHMGILAYRDGFFIVDYYPDQAVFSELFKWEDKDTAWKALQVYKPSRSGATTILLGDFASLDAETYRLFDLHRGHGWHRNTYVGIAVRSVDQKLNWKVIKHFWHDMERRFDELDIFRKIYGASEKKLCIAGIVRVDMDESRILGTDETPGEKTGESVNRRSVLIVMKTLGKALSSCSSVMKFLKAMYDLVEIDRMLVEDHQILHRDISWTNVLIDAIHADEDSDNHDDLCGRPFIDEVLGVEGKMKVHATLSDFDCACILGSDREREPETLGEITGTPMFTAKALCLDPSALCTLPTRFKQACEDVYPERVTGVNKRQDEVTAFLCIVDKLGNTGYKGAQESVVHAPMYDAESIFWLIVLFFLRAWPKGYDPKQDPNGYYRRLRRNEIFKSIVRNSFGTGCDSRSTPIKNMLPPPLDSFAEMLSCLRQYFLQAWHDSEIITGQHQFHAHNAIQAVLLKEIKKLQTSGDDIELNPTPLGLDSDVALVPDPLPYILGTKRNASDTRGDVQAKKRKVLHETDSNKGNVDDNLMSPSSDDPRLKDFMSVIHCNHDSKLWFMGNQDYVEHAPIVEAGPEMEEKLIENIVKAVTRSLMKK